MGIPKFLVWYSRDPRFRRTISNNLPRDVDVLAIDVNGIIHQHAQKIYGYGENYNETQVTSSSQLLHTSRESMYAMRYMVFDNVYKDILRINGLVRPRRSLILAVDGVAPQAKINQQRERRYKSAAGRKATQLFDSNSITPGTEFMI